MGCRNRNILAIDPQETQSSISVFILPTGDETNIGPACIGPILSPCSALNDSLIQCGVCGPAFRDYSYQTARLLVVKMGYFP